MLCSRFTPSHVAPHVRGNGRRLAFAAFLGLAILWQAPAGAVTQGTGASDTVTVPTFADVAAYNSGDGKNAGNWVQIGTRTLPNWMIGDFFGDAPVTSDKLIETYTDAASYLADTGRADRLFAVIGTDLYSVAALEALDNYAALTDSNLPDPITLPPTTVALGDNAAATAYDTVAVGAGAKAPKSAGTAVGANSEAGGAGATAVGANARAIGPSSVAIGEGAHVIDGRSIAIGRRAATSGRESTVVGTDANNFGANAAVFGNAASAVGNSNTALGRFASTANWGPGGAQSTAIPEGRGLGGLIRCALTPDFVTDGQRFIDDCSPYLTAGEKAHTNLFPDTAAGRTYRGTIQTRLRARLNAHAVNGATAVGAGAYAGAGAATAVGAFAIADAQGASAFGYLGRAHGDFSSAFGGDAFGDNAHALGTFSDALGDDSIAIGRNAVAGMETAPGRVYFNLQGWLNDADKPTGGNVAIAGQLYSVAALTAVSGLAADNLPPALVANPGAIAIGADAVAAGDDSVALGRAASATGDNAIAVGAGATALADQVVIGAARHSYRLPGLAETGVARLLAVDAQGRLVVGAPPTGGSADFGTRLAALEVEARLANGQLTTLVSDVGAVDERLGEVDDGADRAGNAYQRIGALDNDLGAPTQAADGEGSAYQRIGSLKTIVDTVVSEDPAAVVAARAEQRVEESTRALTATDNRLREAIESADTGDRIEKIRVRTGTGETRTVVTLHGAANEQLMTLVALLTDRSLSTTVALGEDGEPVGTTMTEFLALDETKGHNVVSTKERLAYLFQALYGPDYAGVAVRTTDSDSPHRDSIAGRVSIIELDDEGKKLREADDGIGAGAHSVVVQEVSPADGRGRLRTMPFDRFDGAEALRKVNALTGRVDGIRSDLNELDTHVDRVAAMTSALTALPNTVTAGQRYSLGMGVGAHRGEQALALGVSMRLLGERGVFVNAGAAFGEDSTVTARAGVNISW